MLASTKFIPEICTNEFQKIKNCVFNKFITMLASFVSDLDPLQACGPWAKQACFGQLDVYKGANERKNR